MRRCHYSPFGESVRHDENQRVTRRIECPTLGVKKRHKVTHVTQTLRRASVSDLDDLMVVEQMSYTEPFTGDVFQQFLEDPTCVCVLADDNGTIVGYALASVNLHLSQLLSIAVMPSHRSQGVARRLLAGVMDYCRASGAENIRLEVRSANYAARRLYEAMGFSLIGLRNKYYGDDDALVMRAELQLEE